jgi:hypothetical protein
MKKSVGAVLLAAALMGTPALAANPVEPDAPSSDKTPGVTPNDAKASPTVDTSKNTGAENPDTPDPTSNTPGSEAKK